MPVFYVSLIENKIQDTFHRILLAKIHEIIFCKISRCNNLTEFEVGSEPELSNLKSTLQVSTYCYCWIQREYVFCYLHFILILRQICWKHNNKHRINIFWVKYLCHTVYNVFCYLISSISFSFMLQMNCLLNPLMLMKKWCQVLKNWRGK